MKIGCTNSKNTFSDNPIHKYFLSKNFWYIERSKVIAMLTILGIILFGALCFYMGAEAHRKHLIRNHLFNSLKEIAETNYRIPFNYVLSWFSAPEKIVIDMKFKHIQRMEFNKDLAINEDIISETIKDISLPAKVKFKNKNFNAKISLHGTQLDHVNSDQYSMRLKLKNETIMGMRKFLLLNPKTRNGLYGWFSHNLMRFEGLFHLRYKFVNVILNGEDKGVYVLEELFDKRLVENNRQREGVILSGGSLLPTGKIKIYHEEKLLLDSSTKNSIPQIIKILKSFRSGNLSLKKFYDYPKMARFLAVVKLLGGEHSLIYDNIRFFFNSITGRLEPIGREFNLKANIDYDVFKDELYRDLLNDPEFVALYVQNLLRLSHPDYLKNIFNKLDLDLRKNKRYIHRQSPHHFLDKNYFFEQQKKINSELALVIKKVKVKYLNKGNKIVLMLKNASNYPLEIISLSSNSQILNKLFNQELNSNKNIFTGNRSFEFKIPKDNLLEISESLFKMKISLKIFGSNTQFEPSLISSNNIDVMEINNELIRKSPNIKEFNFIKLNEKYKEINLLPGQWTINKDIIFPPGYTVKGFSGTQLNLEKGASIVSYSPLKFYGTEKNPLIIKSIDGTGRGIVVLNSGRRASKFFNVEFIDLSRPKGFSWGLTSAITFYESDVHFDKSIFRENHDSDDYLNIIRSEFSITRSKFLYSFADSVDVDFSKGSITNVVFLGCGKEDKNGDCVDISGSNLSLKRILINGATDKALSIGENSKLYASDISISNATVGVVSKDSSEINLDGISVTDSLFGFASYQKKSEFGPGKISAKNFIGESIETLHIIEEDSSLILNNKLIDKFSREHPLEIIKRSLRNVSN